MSFLSSIEENIVSELDLAGLVTNAETATIETIEEENDAEEEEEEDEGGEEGNDNSEEGNDRAVQEELEKLMSMFCNPQGSGDGCNDAVNGLQSLFQNLFSPQGNNNLCEPTTGFEFQFDNPDVASLYDGTSSSPSENAGIDLFMPESIEIPAKSFGNVVDLKVTAVLRENIQKTGSPSRAFWLLPRSSTGLKTPLRLSNSMGLIDAGYRNTLKAIVDNFSETPYLVEKGSRLFQICTGTLEPLTWKKVDEIQDNEEYERGLSGLGDSGK